MWYNIKLKVREEGCFAPPTKKAIARAMRGSGLTIGEFRVDRPFLFIVTDYGSADGPLELIGRVLHPKQVELVEIAKDLRWGQEEPVVMEELHQDLSEYQQRSGGPHRSVNEIGC